MDNILNGEKLNRGHGFGITDNYFTELGLSTPIDLPHEQYPVVYFPNPKQGWWDKFWNGTSYIFMTLDYISCVLTKRAPDPACSGCLGMSVHHTCGKEPSALRP